MSSFPETHPKLDDIVRVFDIPAKPVDLYLRGLNGSLDYAGLTFGNRYRVRQAIVGNRLGKADKGEVLRFLGCYLFPYDNGLRLYFERGDGAERVLEFEGNFPEAEGVVRMISPTNRAEYFAPLRFDFSKRTRRLMAARAVIDHHKKDPSR